MKNKEPLLDMKIYKPVFWGVLVCLALLFGAVAWEEGGIVKKPYAVCNLPEGVFCENPFLNTSVCDSGKYPEVCRVQYFPGQSELGQKPGPLYDWFLPLAILIILAGFIVNHFVTKQKGVGHA